MSYVKPKCITCGKPIIKPVIVKGGKRYCNDCVKKTNILLSKLDKMIPYEETEQ